MLVMSKFEADTHIYRQTQTDILLVREHSASVHVCFFTTLQMMMTMMIMMTLI